MNKVNRDLHPAIIQAELKMRGWSVLKLSQMNGYKSNALQKAFTSPYPKAERIIAKALNKSPEEIWPSRYEEILYKVVAKKTNHTE